MLAWLSMLMLSATLHGAGWLTGEQPSAARMQSASAGTQDASPGTQDASAGRQDAKSASRSAATANEPVWLDVPFVAQTTDGCGSAALAMVMRYWQREQHQPMTADPVHMQQQLYSRHAHGIYASRMVDLLRRSGFAAYPFHGQWSDLAHHIALGRPLLLAVRDGGAHGPLHYVVAVGVEADAVYLNDPARQRMLRLSRAGLEAEWSATDDWTLLAVPESTATPSAAQTTPGTRAAGVR